MWIHSTHEDETSSPHVCGYGYTLILMTAIGTNLTFYFLRNFTFDCEKSPPCITLSFSMPSIFHQKYLPTFFAPTITLQKYLLGLWEKLESQRVPQRQVNILGGKLNEFFLGGSTLVELWLSSVKLEKEGTLSRHLVEVIRLRQSVRRWSVCVVCWAEALW